MGFEKPSWTYNPPETVWAPSAKPAPEALRSSAARPAGTPRRNEVVRRLRILAGTARFLSEALEKKYQSKAVVVPDSDPDLSAALSRLFAADEVPAVTSSMYARLLDALLDAIRTQALLEDSGLPYEISPLQQMDLIRAVAAVEDALVASDSLDSQHLLALPFMKADAWMLDAVADSMESGTSRALLDEESAFAALPAEEEAFLPEETPLGQLVDLSKLEVSFAKEPEPLEDGYRGFDEDTSVVEEPADPQPEEEEEPEFSMDPEPDGDISEQDYADWLDRTEDLADQYAAHWGLLTGAGSLLDEDPGNILLDAAQKMDEIYSGVRRLMLEYFTWPANRIIAILATLETAWRLLKKDKLAMAKGAFGIFVLSRLVQETSRLNFYLQRILSRLTSPVEIVLNSAARLTNLPYEALLELDSVLSSARNSRIAGKAASKLPKDGVDLIKEKSRKLPKALSEFSRMISSGRAALMNRVSRVQASMFQLIDRRLMHGASQAEALESLRTFQELKSIFTTLLRRKSGLQTKAEAAAARIQEDLPKPAPDQAAVLQEQGQARWTATGGVQDERTRYNKIQNQEAVI